MKKSLATASDKPLVSASDKSLVVCASKQSNQLTNHCKHKEQLVTQPFREWHW